MNAVDKRGVTPLLAMSRSNQNTSKSFEQCFYLLVQAKADINAKGIFQTVQMSFLTIKIDSFEGKTLLHLTANSDSDLLRVLEYKCDIDAQ